MKISELINSLTIQLELHGDIDVVTLDSGYGCEIENVKYVDYDTYKMIRNSIVLD